MLFWLISVNMLAIFFNSSGSFGPTSVVAKDTLAISRLSYNFLKSFMFNQAITPYFSVLDTFWHIYMEDQYCLLIFFLFYFFKRKNSKGPILALLLLLSFILFDYDFNVDKNILG